MTNPAPEIIRSGNITITKGEFFREVTYNLANPDLSPSSLGRNGALHTLGMVFEVAGPSLRIAPINSKNKVGRCHVGIPMDREHLVAMRDALDSLIQERFPDAKPAPTKYLTEGPGLAGRVIRVIEILLNYGCITEDYLYEITDNLVFDHVGTTNVISDKINNAGYDTQIVTLGEHNALFELTHRLADKIRVPSQNLDDLIKADDFQPLSVLTLMDQHLKSKAPKSKTNT